MPGEASGDARLPSAGGDFEDCLFAQTSFGFAKPIRNIEKELIETVASLTRRRVKSQSLLKLDASAERTSADARLASPGRNARRSIRERKAAFGRRRF